jgi:hypothetical protein
MILTINSAYPIHETAIELLSTTEIKVDNVIIKIADVLLELEKMKNHNAIQFKGIADKFHELFAQVKANKEAIVIFQTIFENKLKTINDNVMKNNDKDILAFKALTIIALITSIIAIFANKFFHNYFTFHNYQKYKLISYYHIIESRVII